MGRHIVVAGNIGAGKTTLTQLLCKRTSSVPYWEQPEDRLFHHEFAVNLSRWSLANQIDFLMYLADQELTIRQGTANGIQDSGLDQAFHVFTKHLHNRGNLTPKEYQLCERLYVLLRRFFPPPDLIVRIVAPIPSILQRMEQRGRPVDQKITPSDEIADIELLLDSWLGNNNTIQVLNVDTCDNDPAFSRCIDDLVATIESILGATSPEI